MDKPLKNGMLAGALALLAGCATGPDFRTPAAPESDSWGEAAGGAAQRFDAAFAAPADWWTLFGSAELDAAVAEALAKSPTLEQALARLRQAQEEYNAQAGAVRYPAVDAGFGAKRQKVNPEAMGMENVPVPDPFSLYQASLSVSYAFDLFGKDRRTLEALQAQVDRREIELEGARRTLAANVVLAAIRLAETEARIEAAAGIAAARAEQFEIARQRRDAGGISAREVAAAGWALEQARAALPALDIQRARLRRQLAVYLGREPAAAPAEIVDLDELRLPAEVPASVPSEVARRRPDIRAAEAVWHRACANVGAATADLYPRLTIVASLGSQETDLGDVLSRANVWSLGGDLMQPVFRGGALRARKRAAEAAYDEAAAAYRETVLRGLQEVADVLQALETDARTLQARAAAADHARAAREIADGQVAAGGLSRAAALEERVREGQAESERIAAQAARYADTAALFHAVGGAREVAP
ncbi:MAG: efflux transporter outer membrane subunit [Kiritimatiellia bacterium]